MRYVLIALNVAVAPALLIKRGLNGSGHSRRHEEIRLGSIGEIYVDTS